MSILEVLLGRQRPMLQLNCPKTESPSIIRDSKLPLFRNVAKQVEDKDIFRAPTSILPSAKIEDQKGEKEGSEELKN